MNQIFFPLFHGLIAHEWMVLCNVLATGWTKRICLWKLWGIFFKDERSGNFSGLLLAISWLIVVNANWRELTALLAGIAPITGHLILHCNKYKNKHSWLLFKDLINYLFRSVSASCIFCFSFFIISYSKTILLALDMSKYRTECFSNVSFSSSAWSMVQLLKNTSTLFRRSTLG